MEVKACRDHLTKLFPQQECPYCKVAELEKALTAAPKWTLVRGPQIATLMPPSTEEYVNWYNKVRAAALEQGGGQKRDTGGAGTAGTTDGDLTDEHF